MPDLSIVVVNYRTPELTLRAIEDARAACAELDVEEILVDNGATDADALRDGRPQARVVAVADNRGFAAGVNAGLAVATGRHIALINSDAFCRADALARLVAHLDAHPRAGIAAPALRYADGRRQLNAWRRFPSALSVFFEHCQPLAHPLHGRALHPFVEPLRRYEHPSHVGHVMGAALVVRRTALEAAGEFDEGYFLYFEETEWQRRVSRAGWEIDLVPAAEVVHVGGASGGGAFASPQYVKSLNRYFERPRAAIAAARVGEAITLAVAWPMAKLRRHDPRWATMATGARAALRVLRAG